MDSDFVDSFDAFFFDLDGTLIGLPDDAFEVDYVKLITPRFLEYLDQTTFVTALWKGTEEMLKHNDPSSNTLEAFFKSFTTLTGLDRDLTYNQFDQFYRMEFNKLKEICDPVPEARQLVDRLKSLEKKIVLATQPIFPEIATRSRCKWSDMEFDEFDYVSHAENSTNCKPVPDYFLHLCEKVNVAPSRVLMVGNDFLFDMAAAQVGMKTWMIDRYQGNTDSEGMFNIDYKGSLAELLDRIS